MFSEIYSSQMVTGSIKRSSQTQIRPHGTGVTSDDVMNAFSASLMVTDRGGGGAGPSLSVFIY